MENKIPLIKLVGFRDLALYTDIALLVDRPDYLDLVRQYRYILGMDYSYPDKTYDYTYREFISLTQKYKDFGTWVQVITENFRHKFSLPLHFNTVIKKSIVTGVITQTDYSRAKYSFRRVPHLVNRAKDDWSFDMNYYITLQPSTRKKDVVAAYKKFKAEVDINVQYQKTGEVKRNRLVSKDYWYDPSQAIKNNTNEEIKKYRSHYQQYYKGLSPLKIVLKKYSYSLKLYKSLKKQNKLSDDFVTDRKNIKRELAEYKKLIRARKKDFIFREKQKTRGRVIQITSD